MLHKLLLGLLALTLLAGISGCDQADPTPSDENVLVIWWAEWDPAKGLQELAQQYTEKTGVRVRVDQISWNDFHDQVMNEFGNKRTAFDIVIGDSQWLGRGATKGLYLELTDWLPTAVDLSQIHPKAIRYLCEYPPGSGKYFAAPCETDAVGFVYRKDLFTDSVEMAAFKKRFGSDLEVPQTWSQLRDIAEFFHRPTENRFGLVMLTGRSYDALTMGYQQIMWAFGGSWGDEATHQVQGHVNTEGSMLALGFMKELMKYGPNDAANSGYGETLQSFNNGSTAMMSTYFAFFPNIAQQFGDRVGFFVVPSHRDQRAVSLGGQGMSISAKTSPAKQQMAKDFIEWFASKEVQEQWVTKPAGFTARLDILRSEAFRNATPYNAAFADSLDHMRDFWNVPQYADLLAASQQSLGEALDGKPPKQALDELAAKHEKIMRDAGHLK